MAIARTVAREDKDERKTKYDLSAFVHKIEGILSFYCEIEI